MIFFIYLSPSPETFEFNKYTIRPPKKNSLKQLQTKLNFVSFEVFSGVTIYPKADPILFALIFIKLSSKWVRILFKLEIWIVTLKHFSSLMSVLQKKKYFKAHLKWYLQTPVISFIR